MIKFLHLNNLFAWMGQQLLRYLNLLNNYGDSISRIYLQPTHFQRDAGAEPVVVVPEAKVVINIHQTDETPLFHALIRGYGLLH